jgi:hypothetical protein
VLGVHSWNTCSTPIPNPRGNSRQLACPPERQPLNSTSPAIGEGAGWNAIDALGRWYCSNMHAGVWIVAPHNRGPCRHPAQSRMRQYGRPKLNGSRGLDLLCNSYTILVNHFDDVMCGSHYQPPLDFFNALLHHVQRLSFRQLGVPHLIEQRLCEVGTCECGDRVIKASEIMGRGLGTYRNPFRQC